jgi:hypothetical protein
MQAPEQVEFDWLASRVPLCLGVGRERTEHGMAEKCQTEKIHFLLRMLIFFCLAFFCQIRRYGVGVVSGIPLEVYFKITVG